MSSALTPSLSADVFTPAVIRARIDALDIQIAALSPSDRALKADKTNLRAHPAVTRGRIDALDIQIAALSTSIRAFKAEQKNLRESLAAPVHMFTQAPKLEELLILRGFIPNKFTLPRQLTTISFTGVHSSHDIFEVLREVINLTIFVADFESTSGDDTMETVTNILPLVHLTTLQLDSDSTGPSHMQLLQELTLQGLLNLRINEPCFAPNPVATSISVGSIVARGGRLVDSKAGDASDEESDGTTSDEEGTDTDSDS
ncbi:hypothetical protein DFH07DRAFT_1068036 [Mycena maculata]|uniref:Uncharacterized protein n=1 Tax=Mycena maculata TaxID=230809 RepID=A0AAD7HE07_9AGAR|nr:hypothetical protein DFH07DRAFT_1068036 [Mycena maculata]